MLDHPGAESFEAPGFYRHIVEQQRVDHDPHHRPKREDRAVGDRIEGEPDRHFPCADGDDQADDEPGQSRLPGRAAEDAEQDQHRQHRQDGDEKRQPQAVADWRQ